ncbi:hypothetical protein L798_01204 [Zootermopsis nevadensis]|uniref:Uncharacterized protein n=1 Tax=Zootermopsis nevadensis TaxID=136037 RepID=A0A067QI71_ZOONE|nr:hypothetical protein L798_01204 [Zootermopsis nevadensis]
MRALAAHQSQWQRRMLQDSSPRKLLKRLGRFLPPPGVVLLPNTVAPLVGATHPKQRQIKGAYRTATAPQAVFLRKTLTGILVVLAASIISHRPDDGPLNRR